MTDLQAMKKRLDVALDNTSQAMLVSSSSLEIAKFATSYAQVVLAILAVDKRIEAVQARTASSGDIPFRKPPSASDAEKVEKDTIPFRVIEVNWEQGIKVVVADNRQSEPIYHGGDLTRLDHYRTPTAPPTAPSASEPVKCVHEWETVGYGDSTTMIIGYKAVCKHCRTEEGK